MGAVSHCLVVCAAPFGPRALGRVTLPPDALVIAADGGYLRCQEQGLVPQLILGDFDSAPRPHSTAETLVFPSHKDDTDSKLAIKEGLSRGCTHFTILGATGGRLDHTLASVQSLRYLAQQGATGLLADDHCTIQLLEGPASLTLPQQEGYLSVFSLGDCCTGVTLAGVEYPLEQHTLTNGFPLGVSNHITAPHATIAVATGSLLVMTVTEE